MRIVGTRCREQADFTSQKFQFRPRNMALSAKSWILLNYSSELLILFSTYFGYDDRAMTRLFILILNIMEICRDTQLIFIVRL